MSRSGPSTRGARRPSVLAVAPWALLALGALATLFLPGPVDGPAIRTALANGATVVMVSGAVLASAGAALIVFSPRPSSSSAAASDAARAPSLRAGIALGPGTFGVSGAW